MTPISVDRKFGFYQMSIASSLAFEGLLHTGEHADWKGELPIHDYQEIFLNLRTLFRNAFYAFEENRERLTADVLLTSIEEDITNIMATAQAVAPSVLCVPYLCTYKSANKTFPEASFRSIASGENKMTPTMLHYNALEHDALKLFDEKWPEAYRKFDVFPDGKHDTLMLTHLPADLLARTDFPKLGLLESHTGKVKTQLEWYTKLNNKPEQIPFNKAFLTIFGDAYMFAPLDRKVRTVLLKTAEKYHWRQDTTMDRIYSCLRLVNEPHVMEFLRRCSR
ncbi:hypothetical protein G173_gp210 [Erwinia phage phiEaH2]|uniref:Uncharacterized protein n=1 Tax=Erwinia phage phiEaH2 TaxID=1029988 RepID=J7KKU1_9CAUD|nr:hypothetical protein G173_gp210 [Erwinia phage phiEaH2]AFQ96755.1 hypothetical protein [Erwinia phage phiEaH2]